MLWGAMLAYFLTSFARREDSWPIPGWNVQLQSNDSDPANNIAYLFRLSDSLLIKKYKTQYEDSIIEIDTNTELKILQLTILYGNALANKDDKEAKKYLEEINLLQNLKASLKNTMKHVDKH